MTMILSFWWNDFSALYFDKKGRMEQFYAKKSTKWWLHLLDVFMHDYTFEKTQPNLWIFLTVLPHFVASELRKLSAALRRYA